MGIGTTTALLNTNLKACLTPTSMLTRDHTEKLAGNPAHWKTLSKLLADIGELRSADKAELDKACAEVTKLTSSAGSFLQHRSEFRQGGVNYADGYRFKAVGLCRKGKREMRDRRKISRRFSFQQCANLCSNNKKCECFAYIENLEECRLYFGVPDGGNGRSSAECFQKSDTQTPPKQRRGSAKPKSLPAKTAVPLGSSGKESSHKKGTAMKKNQGVEGFMKQLDEMEGLESVKTGVKELAIMVEFSKIRAKLLPY